MPLEVEIMDKSTAKYKELVDGLAGIKEGVLPRWIKEKGWPDLPENKEINDFVLSLTDQQKDILVNIVSDARAGGIHDTLAFLSDKMNIDGLRLVEEGIEIAHEPYGTQIYYDWICRCEGDEWPD